MNAGWESIDAEYRATRRAMRRGEAPSEPSMLRDFWPDALARALAEVPCG